MVRVLTLMTLVAGTAACGDPCGESGTTCTLLGTGQAGGNPDETDASESLLYGPMDVELGGEQAGTFFVADWNNHQIKRVIDGQVEIVVGTHFLGDGDPDFNERIAPGVPGDQVALNHPTQLEWNPVTGRLLLPSWHNHRVREWDPATGNSLVVAADTDPNDGNGANAGFAGDGGPAADALMAFPNSIAIDPSDGSFWLLAQRNGRIRKVAADFSLIETMAGNGEEGYAGDGGAALDASFHFWDYTDLQPEPAGAVAHDGDGHLYIADTCNHAIRVIDLQAGTIDTVAGTGEHRGPPGSPCDPDQLCFPHDVEVGPDGLLYIADTGNHRVRALDPVTGELTEIAGTGVPADGADGVLATETALDRPYGVDVADDGTVYIADTYNHRIRMVIP